MEALHRASTTKPAAPTNLDLVALDAILDGDTELLRDLATLLATESRHLLRLLKLAVDRGHPAGVAEAAHALKGMLANFGAGPAWQTALALEERGRVGRLEGSGSLATALRSEIESLQAELGGLLRRRSAEHRSQ